MSTTAPRGNGTSLHQSEPPAPAVPESATVAEAGSATGDAATGLAALREQVVALLDALERPPRSVRVRAGSAELDITWSPLAAPLTAPVLPILTPTSAAPPVAASVEAAPAAEPATPRTYLTSAGVGVFYHAPEPGAAPFVSVGNVVVPGQQIGIIEAMKLMVPVEADRAGRISEVIKGNGEAVQYGEPLFALESEEG